MFLYLKALAWLRLFSGTSFYIRLIIETIKGISNFMVIFFIFLAAFANAIYILNLKRIKSDSENLLITSYTDSDTLTNAFLM